MTVNQTARHALRKMKTLMLPGDGGGAGDSAVFINHGGE